jgi:hypothetical protein
MRRLFQTTSAVAALLALSIVANAADVGARPPVYAPPPVYVAPLFSSTSAPTSVELELWAKVGDGVKG